METDVENPVANLTVDDVAHSLLIQSDELFPQQQGEDLMGEELTKRAGPPPGHLPFKKIIYYILKDKVLYQRKPLIN